MPLLTVWDPAQEKAVSSTYGGYLDRLSKWSDIREYLPFLYETAKSYEKVRVLELGARGGNSTLAFLAAAEAVDGFVTSVDIEKVTDNLRGLAPWREHPRWTFIHSDDMDPKILHKLPAEVDVLFVDSSHEYEHTLHELYAYMPRVAPGGVALFHDTRVFGSWSEEGDTIPPVSRALDDYCRETNLSWENREGRYGCGVIRL